MSDNISISRAHAFARLLGYLYATNSEKISVEQAIDAAQVADDVEKVLGNLPRVTPPNDKQNSYSVRAMNSIDQVIHSLFVLD